MPIQQAVTLVCDGLPGITCDATFPTSHSSINDAKREAKEHGWTTPRADKTERIACPIHGPDVALPRTFLLDLLEYGAGVIDERHRTGLRVALGLVTAPDQTDPEPGTIYDRGDEVDDVQGGGPVHDQPDEPDIGDAPEPAIPPIRPRQRKPVDVRDPLQPPPPPVEG